MHPHYAAWLAGQPLKPSSISDYLAEIRRVEEAFGDLDRLWQNDGFSSVLDRLAYSTEDERNGRANPAPFPINGDIRTNLASYRSAIRKYIAFRQSL